jgi:hypothetical protein
VRKLPDKRGCVDIVCRPHCAFFREGAKEDMVCGAAPIARTLVTAKGPPRDSIAGRAGAPDGVRDHDRLLLEIVCRCCPFFVDGCDFRAPSPPPDAVPCGGLIVLDLLLADGLITPGEISAIIDG